jgi:hypothetical protein
MREKHKAQRWNGLIAKPVCSYVTYIRACMYAELCKDKRIYIFYFCFNPFLTYTHKYVKKKHIDRKIQNYKLKDQKANTTKMILKSLVIKLPNPYRYFNHWVDLNKSRYEGHATKITLTHLQNYCRHSYDCRLNFGIRKQTNTQFWNDASRLKVYYCMCERDNNMMTGCNR